jgi:hypothetical protein
MMAESVTVGGTVSIIFCKIVEHIVLKVAALVIAFKVTLLSAPKTAASEFRPDDTEIPRDRGSVSGPLIYRTATWLSKSVVASKSWKSLGAVPGATMLLKSPA